MTSRLFTLASLLSLLLCLATAALWVRSYRVGDEIGWSSRWQWTAGGGTARGVILLAWIKEPAPEPGWHHYSFKTPPDYRDMEGLDFAPQFAGFGLQAARQGDSRYYGVFAPLWFIVALELVLPIWCFIRFRRRRRHDSGHCKVCGYDIRASPERCPECGTPTRAEASVGKFALEALLALSLTILAGGCASEYRHLPQESYAPPLQSATQVAGTYIDHSPSQFGGSLWNMLTGDDADEPGGNVPAQTRVEVSRDGYLIVTRLVNGAQPARRRVPYKIVDGYLRISRKKFWTAVLFSSLKLNEVAIAVEPSHGLRVWHEYAPLGFILVVPIPGDPGPPPYWRPFPRGGGSVPVTTRAPVPTAVPNAGTLFRGGQSWSRRGRAKRRPGFSLRSEEPRSRHVGTLPAAWWESGTETWLSHWRLDLSPL